jgi:general secretion pathway protein E/type IV pilus assembly protein PilB
VYRAVGCTHCRHHGYRGRMAIMEILKFTPELDEMISRRASTRELRAAATAAGFRPLIDDGMRRVLEGTTSLDEVSRVVDLTERLA